MDSSTNSTGNSARFELEREAEQAARLQALVALAECAAVGVLVAAVVFTAGIASGADASTRLVLLAVLIANAVAFLAWHELPSSHARVVRRVDRRAALDGALSSILQPARETSVSSLLAARVRRRLGRADFLRAAWPRTPLAVLAPLLAVALIAFALERAPSAARVRPDSTLSGSAAALRDEAARSRADGDARGADALEIAARRIQALADQGVRAAADVADSAARRDARNELRRSAQAPELAAGIRNALSDAADALDPDALDPDRSAPNANEVASPNPGVGIAGQPGTGREPSAGTQAPGGTRPSGETSGGDALANASGDGRMLGPPAGGESEPRASGEPTRPFAGGGAGRGVVSARWWPSRYDAVVERYLTP